MQLADAREYDFKGFSRGTFEFLRDLDRNNDTAWFEANRPVYEEYVLQPLRGLVCALGDFMLTIDPSLEVHPAVNKTISRIRRDTRFSRDKSPYRSVMWIVFKQPRRDWKDAPAYFFEITPASYRYGMGFYAASRATMDALRRRIDERPEEFLEAVSFYRRQHTFVLEGEKYKRHLPGTRPPEIEEWYQRKSFYLACNRRVDERLFTERLVDDLMGGFDMVSPLYRYLWEVRAAGTPGDEADGAFPARARGRDHRR